MAGLFDIFKGGAQQQVQPAQQQAQQVSYTPSGVPVGAGVNTALFRQLQAEGFSYEAAKDAALTGLDPRVKKATSSPYVSQVNSNVNSIPKTQNYSEPTTQGKTYSNEEIADAINKFGTQVYGGQVMPQTGSAADIFALQDQLAKDRLSRQGLFSYDKGYALSPDQLSQIDTSAENVGRERLKAAGQAYAGELAKAKNQTSSGYSEKQLDNERALLSMYTSQPIVKDYNTVITSKLGVDNILNSGVGGAQDLALVYSFMKALDPGSVVRETEYATAANSGNIFTGALARFNGLFNPAGGFMSPQLKKEFQNIINSKMKSQQAQYENYRGQIRSIAQRQGLDPDNVTIDFTGGFDDYNQSGDIIRPEDVF